MWPGEDGQGIRDSWKVTDGAKRANHSVLLELVAFFTQTEQTFWPQLTLMSDSG